MVEHCSIRYIICTTNLQIHSLNAPSFASYADEMGGLEWNRRYKIIKGICNGLHYLHDECQADGSIIHLDLKPENVLLDENFVPKISDFGLAKLFDHEKTQTSMTLFAGSL